MGTVSKLYGDFVKKGADFSRLVAEITGGNTTLCRRAEEYVEVGRIFAAQAMENAVERAIQRRGASSSIVVAPVMTVVPVMETKKQPRRVPSPTLSTGSISLESVELPPPVLPQKKKRGRPPGKTKTKKQKIIEA